MANIRYATSSDLDYVHQWLADEQRRYDAYVDRRRANAEIDENTPRLEKGFLCNWMIIQDYYDKKELQILLTPKTSQPVAFLCASLPSVQDFCTGITGIDILEVHPDHRKKGYGRELATHVVAQARDRNICIMRLECVPQTSEHFWKKMGYRLYREDFGKRCGSHDQYRAYQILNKKNNVIAEGRVARINIQFCDEGGNLLNNYHVEGVCNQNIVYLRERAIGFNPCNVGQGDMCVTIKVDGNELYSGKTKREKAKEYGVIYIDSEVSYVDKVLHMV